MKIEVNGINRLEWDEFGFFAYVKFNYTSAHEAIIIKYCGNNDNKENNE
jgi:hypothetical protein